MKNRTAAEVRLRTSKNLEVCFIFTLKKRHSNSIDALQTGELKNHGRDRCCHSNSGLERCVPIFFLFQFYYLQLSPLIWKCFFKMKGAAQVEVFFFWDYSQKSTNIYQKFIKYLIKSMQNLRLIKPFSIINKWCLQLVDSRKRQSNKDENVTQIWVVHES